MTRPCDILIQAACIVTQDAMRTVIEDGALAVADGMVLAVGPREAVAAAHAPARVLNLGDALVMPGLVNAHTHAAMTFLRGVADDLPLMDWLTQHIFPVEKHLTPDIVQAGALLGCAEMLRTGTTAFNDMYLIQDATYRAVDTAGLRCLGGEGIFGFPSPAYPDADAGLALVRSLHETWRHNPRIRQCVTPHAVYTTSPELLQRCQSLAEELDLPLHIHLAETTTETAQCQQMFGQRPVPYCHGLGLLTPRATVAHAVDLTDDEIDLLASTGTAVAHNPESNMKLASGAAPVPQMLARGIAVGIGTDGAASNNSLNMFTEMTSCAMLHKLRCMDPTCAPAQSVLDMATLGGAAALHWPGLGQLAPGCPADLTALDLSAPNLQPMYNPASHLVYAATGHEVRLTMVAGEVLYQDGRFTRFDYHALVAQMRDVRRWVLDKLGR
ncbi:MAG: amidohydrolase [Desulfovibrio sp.]|jgi:5-methylthioadenosine/S-adenosylhomocysteine deaminase|nr:amidohydrolase [Desulfovibrio sp.]